MYREGLAGKIKVELVATKKEAEKATYRAQPDVVVLGRPAGAHSSWSSWVASSSRRVDISKSIKRVLQRFERVSQRLGRRGESIEKARSKHEKFRGFLLAAFC